LLPVYKAKAKAIDFYIAHLAGKLDQTRTLWGHTVELASALAAATILADAADTLLSPNDL